MRRNSVKKNRRNTKNVLQESNGITLIALIITIIVLLILVGVAISAVVGDNGVLNQAVNAADRTEEERILEEIQLSVAAYQAGVHAGTETRSLSEYLSDELEIDAIRETNYGTLVFKAGTKVVTAYDTGELEIKEYHENTLANNAQIIKESGATTDITADDGFLTDDGVVRKYVKSIIFDTTNTAPSNYNISWDVSELKDGTVMAYATGDETNGYDVTIVADGEIYLPENSTSLFQYCGYNENLPEYEVDLTGLNASNVKNADNLFCDFGYYSMTSLDLGENFYTYNINIMSGMFGRCGYNKMQSLNLGENFDTSNTVNMLSMFQHCGYTSLINLDLKDKFNTSNVTNMSSMFMGCGYYSMTSLNLGDKFDTSNVTDMTSMFNSCGYTLLENLDLKDKFDTSNVTSMYAMFMRCGYNSMLTLDLGDKFDTSNVENLYRTFNGCGANSLIEINFGKFFENISKVTNMQFLLTDCGTSTCKYYVSSETAQNWLLNLDSDYRRTDNWTIEYIIVQ